MAMAEWNRRSRSRATTSSCRVTMNPIGIRASQCCSRTALYTAGASRRSTPNRSISGRSSSCTGVADIAETLGRGVGEDPQMLHLLGGPPRCGKTTFAERVAGRRGIGWLSTDTLRDVVNLHMALYEPRGVG